MAGILLKRAAKGWYWTSITKPCQGLRLAAKLVWCRAASVRILPPDEALEVRSSGMHVVFGAISEGKRKLTNRSRQHFTNPE
jgi:hypothetical protein